MSRERIGGVDEWHSLSRQVTQCSRLHGERERERENVCVCHRRGKAIEIPSNCYKQVGHSSPVTPFTNVYNQPTFLVSTLVCYTCIGTQPSYSHWSSMYIQS